MNNQREAGQLKAEGVRIASPEKKDEVCELKSIFFTIHPLLFIFSL
jgi:hypothetical protein